MAVLVAIKAQFVGNHCIKGKGMQIEKLLRDCLHGESVPWRFDIPNALVLLILFREYLPFLIK